MQVIDAISGMGEEPCDWLRRTLTHGKRLSPCYTTRWSDIIDVRIIRGKVCMKQNWDFSHLFIIISVDSFASKK